jgi:tungstate transport system substrate-binding protein
MVKRLLLVLGLLAAAPVSAAEPFIVLASTTSTEQSGLFKHLLPMFKAASGIDTRVVAVGTGQALKLGERGDADVVLVHDEAAELAFVAAGHGIERKPVMFNDFVIVGPKADPAQVAGAKDVGAAMTKIAGQAFISRADSSGTHMAELRYWRLAGVDLKTARGPWYRETGSGMGATLNMAASLDAYALADRGSWANFRNRRNLAILVEGDPRLFNPYGVMLVNPARHPHVKAKEGRAFIAWLTGEAGRAAIASYTIDGEQQFFPAAR